MQTKSILCKFGWGLLLSCALVIHGCEEGKKYTTVPYKNFTAEIDSLSHNGLTLLEFEALRKEHGRFFALWLNEIIDFEKYGAVNDSLKAIYLSDFLDKNRPVFKAIEKQYRSYPQLIQDASNAIGRLNDLLGGVKHPVVYSYFSQFSNYNTFIDTFGGKTIFAFSSEMFMNDTFPLYAMLEVPEFFNRYNKTSQIPAMLIWNYLKSVYDDADENRKMLGEAVLNGKIWYTMKQVFPNAEPWDLYGYSKKEWKQMMDEEGQIWRHYLTANVLFESDFNKYKRYFNYGTHTFGAGIPPDCPPLIGNFSGYRIVNAYMEKEKISLQDLWKEKDADKILRVSGYNPIK